MNQKIKKLLKQPWQYYISRNLPLWHNELYFINSATSYPVYHLPSFFQLRVHRGTHSDFYTLATGKYSRKKFTEKMNKNLANPNYIRFLKKAYKANGEKLFKKAKNCKVNYNSLKDFFNFYGYCNCMLDITSMASKVITEKLMDLLNNYENKTEIITYYSRPKKLAPLQKLQQDLTKLSRKKINILTEAKKLHQKYFWIPINFVGEPWNLNYFVKAIKNNQLIIKKLLVKPKVKISSKAKYYLNLLSEIAYLNEYRKEIFTKTSWQIRPILQKIAKDHSLKNWQNLNVLLHQEILDLVKDKDNYQKKLINKRIKLCAIYSKSAKDIKVLYGKDVLLFEKKFKPQSEGLNQITGMIANKGKVVGKVRIILEPKDFYKFKTNDILIAKMTSVDFVPIMKKAAAFVTDEGGLASHATIISREYNKPCIIGTKIATAVLRDGDLVEVNANKGTVRKIKKAALN